ncbi:hypothetical protein [Butyrivibrio sp. JL13D10]|uniref:hypothetical protein n=1 Tax=Butyrivibrio sp. JL13D10 TaxID=3236815 RepID=UPI0038B4A156
MKKKKLIVLSLISVMILSACGANSTDNGGIVAKQDEKNYLYFHKDDTESGMNLEDQDTAGYDDYYGISDDMNYYGISDDMRIKEGGCVIGTSEDSRLEGTTHYEGFEEMADTDLDEILYVASGEYPDAPKPQIICNTSWAKVRLTANNGSDFYNPVSITYVMENGKKTAKIKFVKTSEGEIGTTAMMYYDVQVPFKYDVDKAEVEICDEDGNVLESAK